MHLGSLIVKLAGQPDYHIVTPVRPHGEGESKCLRPRMFAKVMANVVQRPVVVGMTRSRAFDRLHLDAVRAPVLSDEKRKSRMAGGGRSAGFPVGPARYWTCLVTSANVSSIRCAT